MTRLFGNRARRGAKARPRETRKAGTPVSRRAALLLAAQGGVAAVLVMRLHRLQIEEADRYRLLADENRINIRLLPPPRGLIFDANGIEVAGNVPNYRAVIVAEEARDLDAVLDRLARLVPISTRERADLKREIRRSGAFVPIAVAENLDWEDVARISLNAPALPGVSAEVGLLRHYPFGSDLVHVVGYVGPVSDYDLRRIEDPDPLLRIPRFQIGKYGLEREMDPVLRGKAGFSRIEVNAAGRIMRELERKEGEPGKDVQLTIDLGLQNFAEARMAGESAAAVVIDTRSGDIRALASTPAFDPNLFVRGISATRYRALLEDPYRPLTNKAVSGAYPPGSTFKMIVALAALEAGEIDAAERIFCPGFYEVGNQRFHCWKRGGHGRLDLVGAIEQSCDVFFYEIARRTGIERIAAMARRFGFGAAFDLPLSAIADGLVPDKGWKQARYGRPWQVGDTVNAGIGQGYVLATPLQLALMSARLASGRALVPRLLMSVGGEVMQPAEAPPLELPAGHLALVRKGMFRVVNGRRGTARRARTVREEYAFVGKTGTSQVRIITREERARGITHNDDLPWERRDHALFVAFGPWRNPTHAVAVVVEHGGSGSKAAAPIARDILLRALHGDTPPPELYPAGLREEVRSRLEAMAPHLLDLPALRRAARKKSA